MLLSNLPSDSPLCSHCPRALAVQRSIEMIGLELAIGPMALIIMIM